MPFNKSFFSLATPLLLVASSLCVQSATGQGNLLGETRMIHNHTTSFLQKGEMDFRVNHAFGDIAGKSGGFDTFYGMDQSSDIYIGFDYGFGKKWMGGLGRSKGGTLRTGNLGGFVKYDLGEWKKVKAAVLSEVSLSMMESVNSKESINYFDDVKSRMIFLQQILLSTTFGSRFSVSLSPFYSHRNRVLENESNSMFGGALGVEVRLSEWWILQGETVITESGETNGGDRVPVYSLGVQMNTGGHKFAMFVSSGRNLGSIYAPYNTSDIAEGQYRFGFTISRRFVL